MKILLSISKPVSFLSLILVLFLWMWIPNTMPKLPDYTHGYMIPWESRGDIWYITSFVYTLWTTFSLLLYISFAIVLIFGSIYEKHDKYNSKFFDD